MSVMVEKAAADRRYDAFPLQTKTLPKYTGGDFGDSPRPLGCDASETPSDRIVSLGIAA